MTVLAFTLFLSGVLITLVCLPLVFGKVPMNNLYGIRLKASFHSEEAWMHLNEIGGMNLAMLGFPLMLGGGVGFYLEDEHLALLGSATAISTLSSSAFAACLFMRYANRYMQGSVRSQTAPIANGQSFADE